MQPLPTEAAPRTACARCGEALPPPNGSATYVYGVGAIGYQNCAKCGANWRYLWHDQPAPRIKSPGGGRGRLFAVLGALVLAAVVVVGVVALARSQRWNASSPTTSAPKTTPRTTPPPRVPPGAAGHYVDIADPMFLHRSAFISWVNTTASSTPEYLLDGRVNSYVRTARDEADDLAALDRRSWPDRLSTRVDDLIAADRTFINDADLVQNAALLHSSSFLDKLNQEALAVHAADDDARRVLGLPPSRRNPNS